MQLRNIVMAEVKEVRNIAAHHLIHMGGNHAGAVDHLIPHIQRLRFLQAESGDRHPICGSFPSTPSISPVGFAGDGMHPVYPPEYPLHQP